MNILITPNVIINCILMSAPEKQKEACIYLLEQILHLQKENRISIFMTSIDILIVRSYLSLFESLKINNNQVFIELLTTYLKNIREYPIYKTTIDHASDFLINPSDALRIAVALSPDIEIDAIVTWEPSHFTQKTSDTIMVESNGWGKVWLQDSLEVTDERLTEFKTSSITKDIYNPNEFIRYFENLYRSESTNLNEGINEHIFSLISLEVNSNINESKAKVTIKYEYGNHEEQLSQEPFTTTGPVSATLGVIQICINRIIRDQLSSEKVDQVETIRNSIRNLFFSVSPVKEQNDEILVILAHLNTKIVSRVKSKNVLHAVAEAYIEIINSIINNYN